MRHKKLPENKYQAALRLEYELKVLARKGIRTGAKKLLAERHKISKSQVSNILLLLKLSEPVKRMVNDGLIRFSHAISIAKASKDRQEEVAYQILSGLKRDQVQAYIDGGYKVENKGIASVATNSYVRIGPDTERLIEHYEGLYGVSFKMKKNSDDKYLFTLLGYDSQLVNELMVTKSIQFDGSKFTLDLQNDKSDGSDFRISAVLSREELSDHLSYILKGFGMIGKLREIRESRSKIKV